MTFETSDSSRLLRERQLRGDAGPCKRLLLRPQDVVPSRDDLEVVGVFNPGATEFHGQVVLLVRVAERPRDKRRGFVPLPRWTIDDGPVVDWMREEEIEFIDPRVVRVKESGRIRLTFVSHLRVVSLTDGLAVDDVNGAIFAPQGEWEEFGVEDARIVPLNGRYYFTYVAVSRHGAATALASTGDFLSFERHGIIFPPENKDVVLFPERLRNEFVALHRPNGATPFTAPEMWLGWSRDLIHWGRHEPLVWGKSGWESGRVGGGTPPLRTPAGWLEIYHGNRRPTLEGDVGEYVAAAMLLDADDPRRIIAQSSLPLFTPTEAYEREGFVQNVVFPTGLVSRDDSLLVYYGASDTYTAVVELDAHDVLAGLCPIRHSAEKEPHHAG